MHQIKEEKQVNEPWRRSRSRCALSYVSEKLWEEAVGGKSACYPQTFEHDGNFTHATNVPQRLIHTTNNFYFNRRRICPPQKKNGYVYN